MKILYVGSYRESVTSGWSRAARDYILALDAAGFEVVPRCIKLGLPPEPLPKRIEELEAKSSQECDVVIQNVLPHLMEYSGGFKKNIGLYFAETDNTKNSSWSSRIDLMDEMIVPNSNMVETVRNNGFKKPVHIIPCPIDVSRYYQSYTPLDITPIKGDFVFYFIGDFNKRKNILALIKAFHLEFTPNEPVSLLIKTNKFGVNSQSITQELQNICNMTKESLKLYKNLDCYKNEVLITDVLSNEDTLRLHKSCNCFVIPSYGEAVNLTTLDAIGMGKQVIYSDYGGPSDICKNYRYGYPVSGTMEPVFGMTDTFHDIFTGRENWFNIDINSLRRAMRFAYRENISADKAINHSLSVIDNYSYQSVGQIAKGVINVE